MEGAVRVGQVALSAVLLAAMGWAQPVGSGVRAPAVAEVVVNSAPGRPCGTTTAAAQGRGLDQYYFNCGSDTAVAPAFRDQHGAVRVYTERCVAVPGGTLARWHHPVRRPAEYTTVRCRQDRTHPT